MTEQAKKEARQRTLDAIAMGDKRVKEINRKQAEQRQARYHWNLFRVLVVIGTLCILYVLGGK